MDYENKIEFYKDRSLGERLSAAAEFLRQNGVVMYKNILIPAIPLVLIQAYCLLKYMEMAQSMTFAGASALSLQGMLFIPAALILSLFLYAMSGAILSRYEEGLLTKETGWEDLSSTMFSYAGKTFKIGLAIGLMLIVVCLVIGLLFGGIGMFLGGIVVFLFVIALIAAMVPLSLVNCPAYFQNASTFDSIKKAFSLGFKNWGTTFLTLVVAGIMVVIVSIIFALPSQLYSLFYTDTNGILVYLFAVLTSFGAVLTTPFTFTFLAFQYFSIAEKEEGVSLQNQIDSFDNL